MKPAASAIWGCMPCLNCLITAFTMFMPPPVLARRPAMSIIQLRRNHQVDGGFMDYGMQLGSGTWDFKPSLTYTGHIDNWSWGAQANGTVRMEDQNKSGYALGDLFQATAWGSYNLTNWLTASVRGVYTAQGRIKGQFTGSQVVNFLTNRLQLMARFLSIQQYLKIWPTRLPAKLRRPVLGCRFWFKRDCSRRWSSWPATASAWNGCNRCIPISTAISWTVTVRCRQPGVWRFREHLLFFFGFN